LNHLCAPRTEELIEKAKRGELVPEDSEAVAALLAYWRDAALKMEATIHRLTK
jgi:hypothetical protein